MDLIALGCDAAPELREGDWVELDYDLPTAAEASPGATPEFAELGWLALALIPISALFSALSLAVAAFAAATFSVQAASHAGAPRAAASGAKAAASGAKAAAPAAKAAAKPAPAASAKK